MLADRIAALRTKLEEIPDQLLVAWHSPFQSEEARQLGLSRLESTYILVAGHVQGCSVALRIPGTLERNEFDHQRLYFEGETLLRVRNGRRAGLVVRPDRLDVNEFAVVAGLQKFVVAHKSADSFWTSRGDMEFLGELERMAAAPRLEMPAIPVPRVYRMVRSVGKVKPRITGDLMVRMRALPGYDDSLSAVENFHNLHLHLCRTLASDSLVFPIELVTGGGLTMVDLSSVDNEIYLIPAGTVDVSTELIRTDIARSVAARVRMWHKQVEVNNSEQREPRGGAGSSSGGCAPNADPGNP